MAGARPKGSSAWAPMGQADPATTDLLSREACPRCHSATLRLCRLVVCTALACEWQAKRLGRTRPREEEATPAAVVSSRRCSARAPDAMRARAERVLEHARSHPWSTTFEIACALRVSGDVVREILVAARASRRHRKGSGAAYEYMVPEQEAVAC
jgi:hypothetical protein